MRHLLIPTCLFTFAACADDDAPNQNKPQCSLTETQCNDDQDNDCDGMLDCDDPDCHSASICLPSSETLCTNIDCADPSCVNVPICQTFSVGWCRLQHMSPAWDVLDLRAPTNLTVFGQVFVAGVTDNSADLDVHPNVLAQVGFGPAGTTPDDDWSWFAAAGNDACSNCATNNDEYSGTFDTPPPFDGRNFDVAIRFSGDGGVTWFACDRSDDDTTFNSADAGHVELAMDYNWDFEDWRGATPLLGGWTTSAGTPQTEASTESLQGTSSCHLVVAAAGTHMLATTEVWQGASGGDEFTTHAWVLDNDAGLNVTVGLALDDHLGGTFADSGEASDDDAAWRELTFVHRPSSSNADLWPTLTVSGGPGSILIDAVALTVELNLGASLTDGVLDTFDERTYPSQAPIVIPHALPAYAGMTDDGVLYAATARANTQLHHDRILYIWVGELDTGAVAAPWAKIGTVSPAHADGALLALIQGEENGYCEWRTYADTDWIVIDGAPCSTVLDGDVSSGDVLEGSVDLLTLLGATSTSALPLTMSFAATSYGTSDGEGMVYQAPPCTDCNDAIDASEVMTSERWSLLLGRLR